jgi:AcrR family transcriptional regulator
MLEMNYEEITVTGIAMRSGVGRATFYRLFDDKPDVIMYQIEETFAEIFAKSVSDGKKVKDVDSILLLVFRVWMKKKNLFFALIKANLYNDYQNRIVVLIGQRLSFVKDDIHLDDKNWKYFVEIRSAMLFAALKVAITCYSEDSPEDIVQTLNFLFENQKNILNR